MILDGHLKSMINLPFTKPHGRDQTVSVIFDGASCYDWNHFFTWFFLAFYIYKQKNQSLVIIVNK